MVVEAMGAKASAVTVSELVTTDTHSPAAVTVTVALPDSSGSAWLVATTVSVVMLPSVVGAVYRPLLETVPPAPPGWTDQVTFWLVAAGSTVAPNCCVVPVCTLAVDGVTVTETEVSFAHRVAAAGWPQSMVTIPPTMLWVVKGPPEGWVGAAACCEPVADPRSGVEEVMTNPALVKTAKLHAVT
jgi:hypothetical protein